jgi:hypothetical protein
LDIAAAGRPRCILPSAEVSSCARDSTKGVLDTRDGSAAQDLFNGGQHNFFIANALCSDKPEVIFDLSEPPSFSDEPMIWGELDRDGSLRIVRIGQMDQHRIPL